MRIGMNELCENCQYNGPYLSIINPCENCPNNDFMINGKIPIVQPLRETTDHITNITYATTTIDCQTITAKSNGANTGDVFATGLNADLPTADEYRKFIKDSMYYPQEWSEPKYICPKCHEVGMRRNEMVVLASYPVQYEYCCDKCGYVEYQFG